MTAPNDDKQGIRARLVALMQALLQDSRVNSAYHSLITNLAKNFIKQVSDQELTDGITKLRDEIIPWLLGEEETPELEEK